MYGYIYLTTNLINNKKYIGRRKSSIFLGTNYLGSGKHLKKAIIKYGKENFSVILLEECQTYDECVLREMYYIKLFNAVESSLYYNASYGGYNEGFVKGDKNIACSPEARKKNSEAHKGKKMSAEFKAKQSELHKGKPSGMLGHTQPEAARKRISEAVTKRNKTAFEIHKKVSESAKGNKMMNKDNKCIRVHEKDFQKYLNDGWIFGGLPRKPRISKNNKMK